MKTIWKYEIRPEENNLEIPVDFIPLSVQVQNGTPCLWCLVDTDNIKTTASFEVFGTGHKIDLDLNDFKLTFVGTFQLDWMVFHVFRRELK